MDDDAVITVEHVSKNFVLPHEKITSVKGAFTHFYRRAKTTREVQHALDDINFEIKKGEFFGIVGRNGSGKSTLLKILAGIYQPSTGNVSTRGKLVPFIELGVGFNPELTGRENVYLNGAILGFSRKQTMAMYDEVVAFAELEEFMDQKLKNYSSGMQVRLAFSLAIRAKADILLIDEVLAVGDADFQRKCFDYFQQLKGSDTTVIFVSHNMNDIREYCDRAVLIEKSKVIDISDADTIAKQYSRMFLENATNTATKATGNRWGTEDVRYDEVTINSDVLADQKELVVTARFVAKVDISGVIVGFSIKNAAKQGLVGTNNLIIGQALKPLVKGQQVTLEWVIPNIFSNGRYSLDATITKSNGDACDWWEDAVTFTVARSTEHAPYLVTPPVTLRIQEHAK